MKLFERTSAIAAAACLVAAPMSVFAEESGGGADILVPKGAEFVPALIAFLIILVVAAKVAWPQVLATMDEREKRIADSMEEAERTKKKALEDRAQSDSIVTDARRQAADIVLAARKDAEGERSRIIAAAHTEAEEIIAKAHENAEEERQAVYAQAAASIADLSVSVASKIVSKELDDSDEQRRLIERYFEEAGSLNVK